MESKAEKEKSPEGDQDGEKSGSLLNLIGAKENKDSKQKKTLNTLLMPPSMRRQLEEKVEEEAEKEVRQIKVQDDLETMKTAAAKANAEMEELTRLEEERERRRFKDHTDTLDDHRRCSLLQELQTVDDEMRIFCDAAISSCDSMASSEKTDEYFL